MSICNNYASCEVKVVCESKEELDKRINAFNKEVEEYDNACVDNDYECVPTEGYVKRESDLVAYVLLHNDGEWDNDIEQLAELICKHFPSANGTLGWAATDMRNGVTTYANGGQIEIRDGKIAKSKEKELEEDLHSALEYISMVVSNGDITECGVSDLFRKYWPEEYKETLENKED